jgi:uncharacterized protein (TIGR02466 family)
MEQEQNFIKKEDYFSSSIYYLSKIEWLDYLNKHSDKHINDRKKQMKKEIANRNKIYGDRKDHGFVYHSNSLSDDPNFLNFSKHILLISNNILDQQGYDLSNHKLVMNELWVQEFAKLGGGHHHTHTHWNGHISGFYFLKCSEKTSFPVFEDPRSGRQMNSLPLKDKTKITYASIQVSYMPKPGDMFFFNSDLPHLFMVDSGYEPFRFIHFNVQAIDKRFLKNEFQE